MDSIQGCRIELQTKVKQRFAKISQSRNCVGVPISHILTIKSMSVYYSVLIANSVKELRIVGTFNQEKALVGAGHDYEPSGGPPFEALVSDKSNKLFTGKS